MSHDGFQDHSCFFDSHTINKLRQIISRTFTLVAQKYLPKRIEVKSMGLRSFLGIKKPTTAPVPEFFQSGRITRTKTVPEVLGDQFDYLSKMTCTSVFCKKLLKFCVKDNNSENLVFILACEKYKKNPSRVLFNRIYNDLVLEAAYDLDSTDMTHGLIAANLSAVYQNQLQKVFEDTVNNPSNVVFDSACHSLKTLWKDDAKARLIKLPFDTAFTLTTSSQKGRFDADIAYLKSAYQIYLV